MRYSSITLLLSTTLFACSNGSVKIDDIEGNVEATEPSSEPESSPTNEPSQEEIDADEDGFLEEDDCDDSDPDINPDAEEICDEGIDNDCDGLVDGDDPDVILSLWYQDADGDGFGDEDYPGYEVCTPPPGFVLDNTDCDDSDVDTNPSGSVNENDPTQCMTDVDGDGYGDTEPTNINAVPGTDCDDNDASNIPADTDEDGYSSCTGDCDDGNGNINPGMNELLWDGEDNNCDGITDIISAEDYDAAISGNSGDYLSYDNSISIAEINGDNYYEVFIGSAFCNGDVDGDGYADAQGCVHMFEGSDYSSWNGIASDYSDAKISGDGLMNYFSSMSPTQGDIDGDGTIDLAIGGTDAARYYQDYAETAGALFFDAFSLSGESNSADADVRFIESESNFGAARMTSNLDIDGDGYKDILFSNYISGYYYQGTYYNQGGSSCYYGACDSQLFMFSGVDLQAGEYSLDDDATQVFDESTDYDYFGQTITGGDIDGDGADELIIGVPGNDDNNNASGCVMVYKGSSDLLNNEDYVWEFDNFDFYSSYDNTSICAETENARLGWNAGGVLGDFNGDGTQDIAVSSPGVNQVFVFFDLESLLGQPHVAESDADVIINGVSSPGTFGYSLAAGDMNGDGADDLAIGAPDLADPVGAAFGYYALLENGSPNENGMVYIFDGTNLSGTLSDEDANATIYSEDTDMFGISIVMADMNADGKEDLWIGAPLYAGDEGRASLYIMH